MSESQDRPLKPGTPFRSAMLGIASITLIVLAGVGGWRTAAESSAASPVAAPATVAADEVVQWTDSVWSAARDGDQVRLERALANPPGDADPMLVGRLRETLEQRSRHMSDAQESIVAEREKAAGEIAKAADEGDLSQALASAMGLQAISDNWTERLGDPQIADLVAQAESTGGAAVASGDLLLAQEMYARLRLLHDGLEAQSREYQKPLDEVNRRIALIAHYAPARLHAMRRDQMARLMPEREFPEFNPVGLDDWREQSSGITQAMLQRALRTAASEHIANDGWKPLLLGGLESMRIFATTPELAESFPTLSDPDRVRRWNDEIDRMLRTLEGKSSRSVALGDYRRIIETVMRTNPLTIDVPESVLLREFGDGAALKLTQLHDDQYTEMIWPERLRRFEQQTEGNFVGVGVMIRLNEQREIVVVHPLEGSPAYRAGILAEDRISSVDGVTTFGWSLNKAVDTITGPRGQVVRLGITRGSADDEPTLLDVPIVRDTIKIRSVNGWHKTGLDDNGDPEWDWMIDPIGRIGYIRLTGFSDDSYADFLAAIDAMRNEGGLNGLILDVRNNPGGLLRSAVHFSNLFVPNGTIVVGENKDGRVEWEQKAMPHRSDARLTGLPLVVLINEASASASEIVAGALQAHNAAIVVGERTFGKGSVQTVHDISDGATRSAIKLTTQHYVLPSRDGRGRPVHRMAGATDWGVNPDLLVRMTPTQAEKAMRVRQEADMVANGHGGGQVGNADDQAQDATQDDAALDGDGDAVVGRRHPSDLLTEGLDPQLQTALMILQARALRNPPAAAAARR